MSPPFSRASSPPFSPHSPFPFPATNFNSTSLFFLPLKPTHFIISATTNQTNTSSFTCNSHMINRDAFFSNKTKNTHYLADTVKHGKIETLTEFNNLFLRLVLADEVKLAFKLYSSLSSYDLSADSSTFSILIFCYCKRNEPLEAKSVLVHMIEKGFDIPKVKTFTQLINSFCKKGKLKQAFEVFEIMGKVKCDPTINTYNCLLKGLCYVGRLEEAYELLSKIKKDLILQPDVYSYTAVMDGFCKVGRSDEALELLDEAIEMGLRPTIVTYNTMFNGYFKEGRPMEVFGLLKQMKERNCVPDYVSYSTLLHGLLQWGEVRAGIRVYNEMLDMGFEVDERMMNTLLRGVCRISRKEKELLNDAYQLFDEMSKRGYFIELCVHELVVEAFCIGNEMDKAFVNLCEMIKKGLSPRTFTMNVVVKGLCDEGKIERAMLLLVLVCNERNEMLDRVAFDVLINELNRQGVVRSATCVYCIALKNNVIPRRKPRRKDTHLS